MPTGAIPEGVSGDYELMKAIAGGDASSLGALYDRLSGSVMALCLRILGSRPDAEEVLSDVFWQVWEQAGRYDPVRGNPAAFVMMVARSRALDKLRTVGRRQKVLVDPGQERPEAVPRETAAVAGTPYEDAVAAQQRSLVEAALATLDPAQRRAVEMSFFEGLSHSEIAGLLGEPLGTIKSRIRQGLIRLRDDLRSVYGQGQGGAA